MDTTVNVSGHRNGSSNANITINPSDSVDENRQSSILSRTLNSTIREKASHFFKDDAKEEERRLWQSRRRRFLTRTCGNLKQTACQTTSYSSSGHDVTDSVPGHVDSDEEEENHEPVLSITYNTIRRRLARRGQRGEEQADPLEVETIALDEDPTPYSLVPHSISLTATQVDGPTSTTPIRRPESYVKSPSFKVPSRTQAENEMTPDIAETFVDNSNRRKVGTSLCWQMIDKRFKKNLTREQKEALDNLDDHRPFFTYWVSTVQILVMIIALVSYGFGPWGMTQRQITGKVLVESLSLEQVDFFEPENIWLGPRAADLIHLGAKYTPCIRTDKLVFDEILRERREEKKTSCCIRNDESGCVQTSRERCSSLLSTWKTWRDGEGPIYQTEVPGHPGRYNFRNRTSGTVCGQDPEFCEDPASILPYEWPDDITKWPVCRRTQRKHLHKEHMTCEIIAKPCCFGIHGQCRILTQQHCEFVNGFFHEEASLCSQVSCLKDVCGMVPFYTDDRPDQASRLFVSIFLHAGLIHLAASIAFQYLFMRDIEKMIGALRIAIIYLGSGVAGNLASAALLPYKAEVGPSGCLFGLMAYTVVEIVNHWDLVENPVRNLLKLVAYVSLFLFAGLIFPWLDNFANFCGFLMGLCLSFAFVPMIAHEEADEETKKKAKLRILVFVIFSTIIMLLLICLVYLFPVYDCPWCKYLNCIPLTDDWCVDQDIKIKRLPIL